MCSDVVVVGAVVRIHDSRNHSYVSPYLPECIKLSHTHFLCRFYLFSSNLSFQFSLNLDVLCATLKMSPNRTASAASSQTKVEPGSPLDKKTAASPQRPAHARFTDGATDTRIENVDVKHEQPSHEILQMEDCYEELGFGFPSWKKWTILTVIFLVQVSMNFNTSLYSNGLEGISTTFGVSEQGARCGAMIFLVLYAFGW